MADLSRVPLSALSAETKHLISTLVNPTKCIPSENYLSRDWRGLLHMYPTKAEDLPEINRHGDQFSYIISMVQRKCPDFTLQRLKDALETIERWDIIEDAEPLLEKDAQIYLERLEKSQSSAEANNFIEDEKILTFDDQCRIERGEETQHYDGFVLYADEDLPFVNELVEVLEQQNNLKLCLKDRDLIAGITFEHEAIMKLISERCNRLITVISPNFLKSPANKFFVSYAQASGIDKKQERKIIPIVYEDCVLPAGLKFFSKIYYSNLAANFFWEKLVRSMKAVSTVSTNEPNKKKKELKTKKQIESSNSKKVNGLTDNQSKKSVEAQEKDSKPTSKLSPKAFKSLKIFPWKKKKQSETNQIPDQVPNSTKKTTTSESIPNLPSLEGLDSLSSISSSTKAKKQEKKFMSGYVKKMQSVLARS